MNISCQIQPSVNGFDYTYVVPIRSDSGANVSAVFGSDFNAPNLFRPVGENEYVFSGKFYYSPNNLKAFSFHSDLPPTEGMVVLRADRDISLNSTVPVPEPGVLALLPLVWAVFAGRRRSKAAARVAA